MARDTTPGLDALADASKILSDPTRLRILLVLGGGETKVGDIQQALGCPQPTVSHHLGLLRTAGVVRPRFAGKNVYYSLTTPVPAARVIHVLAGGFGITVTRR